MNLFGVLDISASALVAERQRAEVVTSNLANADNTAADPAQVYRRQEVVFGSHPFADALAEAGGGSGTGPQGVAVTGLVTDTAPPLSRYEPGSASADANGYVHYPDINPVQEMTDLMEAVRSYQLNASAVTATKSMIQESISLLKT